VELRRKVKIAMPQTRVPTVKARCPIHKKFSQQVVGVTTAGVVFRCTPKGDLDCTAHLFVVPMEKEGKRQKC